MFFRQIFIFSFLNVSSIFFILNFFSHLYDHEIQLSWKDWTNRQKIKNHVAVFPNIRFFMATHYSATYCLKSVYRIMSIIFPNGEKKK